MLWCDSKNVSRLWFFGESVRIVSHDDFVSRKPEGKHKIPAHYMGKMVKILATLARGIPD